MAIIDPVGFLNGGRIGSCSDEAQYHWPRLIAASNSFGRLELSYESIIQSAYKNIKRPPTQAKLAALLAEYRNNFLLFIYTTEKGETWGEWMIPDHTRPRFHSAIDRRSPAPPKNEFEAYRQKYVESVKAKSFILNEPTRPHKPHTSSQMAPVVVGVVVGVGVGLGSTSTLAQTGFEPPTPEPAQPPTPERVYSHYPRKVGKGAALKAIERAAHRLKAGEMREAGRMPLPQAYETLEKAVEAYARSPAGNAGEFTPHPATWFNRSSYLDDPATWQNNSSAKETRHESKFENKRDASAREALALMAAETPENHG